MKKIEVLVVGLLVINSSSVMGMRQLDVWGRSGEASSSLIKQKKRQQIQNERVIKLERQQNIKAETAVLAVGKAVACTFSMIPLTLLQPSDVTDHKESVCFDSTLITALWAVHILTIARSCYEIHTQKPFFKSRSKNMLLSAGQFAASATPMICSAMVNDCPKFAPECINFKEFHSVVSFLAAAYCLYQASLNK